jgi:hypothetical protein
MSIIHFHCICLEDITFKECHHKKTISLMKRGTCFSLNFLREDYCKADLHSYLEYHHYTRDKSTALIICYLTGIDKAIDDEVHEIRASDFS